MDFKRLEPVRIFCNNCGHKLTGYRSRDGTTRFTCDRCGVVTVSKPKNRRVTDMRLTAPPRKY